PRPACAPPSPSRHFAVELLHRDRARPYQSPPGLYISKLLRPLQSASQSATNHGCSPTLDFASSTGSPSQTYSAHPAAYPSTGGRGHTRREISDRSLAGLDVALDRRSVAPARAELRLPRGAVVQNQHRDCPASAD